MSIKTTKGMFPSVKAGGPVYYKTYMQHHYLLLLEFDQGVAEFEHEPFPEQFNRASSSDRIRPDFLVYREWSAELVFLLPETVVAGDAFGQTRAGLTDFCVAQHLDFLLVTDRRLYSDSLVANLRLLHPYSRYAGDLDPVVECEILATLALAPTLSIAELAQTVRPHCPATAMIPIYNLIWRQLLEVPLREGPISTRTLVTLPRLECGINHDQAF